MLYEKMIENNHIIHKQLSDDMDSDSDSDASTIIVSPVEPKRMYYGPSTCLTSLYEHTVNVNSFDECPVCFNGRPLLYKTICCTQQICHLCWGKCKLKCPFCRSPLPPFVKYARLTYYKK
jgi:hypothetical protein